MTTCIVVILGDLAKWIFAFFRFVKLLIRWEQLSREGRVGRFSRDGAEMVGRAITDYASMGKLACQAIKLQVLVSNAK